MIVIKSLKDALHDGDTIRAVIRGTGTNQDGILLQLALSRYMLTQLAQVKHLALFSQAPKPRQI